MRNIYILYLYVFTMVWLRPMFHSFKIKIEEITLAASFCLNGKPQNLKLLVEGGCLLDVGISQPELP